MRTLAVVGLILITSPNCSPFSFTLSSLKEATTPSRSSSSSSGGSSTSSVGQQSPSALYAHQFWRKKRTKAEVELHVRDCLDGVEFCNLEATVEVISAEPPLVVIHDFLSKSMCRDIIETAIHNPNMKPSTTGEENKSTTSRTSSTVWLRDDDCQGPLRLIADKVSSISGLPPSYMENLQVVRYEPGQEFKLHTDHQDSFNELDCRGRLATCLLYLSEPESGGETWFPGLGTANGQDVEPKIAPTQGSAVFFWNTVEKPGSPGYDPNMFLNVDLQLRHAGLPVGSGEKWICNRWIHPVEMGLGVRGTKEPVQATI